MSLLISIDNDIELLLVYIIIMLCIIVGIFIANIFIRRF